ncbi:MAG: TIGR03067 domain-containing protein [Gemmataceae bacterium]
MRKAIAAGVAACIGAVGLAADPPLKAPAVQQAGGNVPAAADPTPKAFVGVWVPVSCQFDGAEQWQGEEGAKVRDAIRLSIEGGQHKLYFITDAQKMLGQRVSTAGLTADEKGGTFELTMSEGLKKGEKVHGIFAFDGDQMKLCYGPADKPRPTKFEAPKGSGTFNEVWTRHKKK